MTSFYIRDTNIKDISLVLESLDGHLLDKRTVIQTGKTSLSLFPYLGCIIGLQVQEMENFIRSKMPVSKMETWQEMFLCVLVV